MLRRGVAVRFKGILGSVFDMPSIVLLGFVFLCDSKVRPNVAERFVLLVRHYRDDVFRPFECIDGDTRSRGGAIHW